MDTTYIVTGEQGSFSDHSVWNVAAFSDKDKAQAFADHHNATVAEVIAACEELWNRPDAVRWDRTGPGRSALVQNGDVTEYEDPAAACEVIKSWFDAQRAIIHERFQFEDPHPTSHYEPVTYHVTEIPWKG